MYSKTHLIYFRYTLSMLLINIDKKEAGRRVKRDFIARNYRGNS
jgi:hypothetical protein